MILITLITAFQKHADNETTMETLDCGPKSRGCHLIDNVTCALPAKGQILPLTGSVVTESERFFSISVVNECDSIKGAAESVFSLCVFQVLLLDL
jgi:hypothetical protein